ncbi:unnamed protein product [Effrenium voratum]|nr:unnamed protein product [Effrenium voratum]
MPGLDYSRFDGIGDSDSDGEKETEEPEAELTELPKELTQGQSLVLAAREGQLHVVEALLQSRAEVNATDPHQGSALLRAVQLGIQARPTIEALLKASADVAQESAQEETPLTEAAAHGHPELLSALLTADPPTKALGPALRTAARAAAAGGSAGRIGRMLLDKGAPVEGALHAWARHGHLEMVQELLSRRADVNEKDAEGHTALLRAAQNSHENSSNIISMLCKSRADLEVPNRKGITPLESACTARSDGLVETLLACGALAEAKHREDLKTGMSPLVAASVAGGASTARLILEARADANSADAGGRRALPCAAASGNLQLCQVLLSARSDPNLRSRGDRSGEGAAALVMAVAAGHAAVVEELLAARADPEQPSERGQTSLMLASSSPDLCHQLLHARANAAATDTDGKTALILAAGAGSLGICQALLAAKADVAQRSTGGAAALHAAAASGHAEVCHLLLAAKADLTPGPAGRSPTEVAEVAGYASLAAMLKA